MVPLSVMRCMVIHFHIRPAHSGIIRVESLYVRVLVVTLFHRRRYSAAWASVMHPIDRLLNCPWGAVVGGIIDGR